jgi:hypothetical protein
VLAETAQASGTLPPTQFWNISGRGYPDASVIGHNYVIQWAGERYIVDGTSSSGPVLAGIVSLLNDVQLNAGKPPLGLVTPWMYQVAASHPGAFYDVVTGSNFDGDLQARGRYFGALHSIGLHTSVLFCTALAALHCTTLQRTVLLCTAPLRLSLLRWCCETAAGSLLGVAGARLAVQHLLRVRLLVRAAVGPCLWAWHALVAVPRVRAAVVPVQYKHWQSGCTAFDCATSSSHLYARENSK